MYFTFLVAMLFNISDLSHFKEEMVAIQNNIESFKFEINSSLSTLQKEEEELLREVDVCDLRLYEYSEPVRLVSDLTYMAKAKTRSCSALPRVSGLFCKRYITNYISNVLGD